MGTVELCGLRELLDGGGGDPEAVIALFDDQPDIYLGSMLGSALYVRKLSTPAEIAEKRAVADEVLAAAPNLPYDVSTVAWGLVSYVWAVELLEDPELAERVLARSSRLTRAMFELWQSDLDNVPT